MRESFIEKRPLFLFIILLFIDNLTNLIHSNSGCFSLTHSAYKEVTSPDNNRDPVRCLLAPPQYSQPGRGPGPAPTDLEVLLLLLLLFPPRLHELLHLQHAPVRLAQ